MKKCYIVPVQKICNSSCVFCISKARKYNKNIEFMNINEDFINRIKTLKKAGIEKIEITGGGEPFLNKELANITKVIKDIMPEVYLKIYTNGNILNANLLVDEINISITHYDDEINDKFMRNKKQVRLIDKLKFFKANYPNALIRLSVVIVKGGIDSEEKLINLIEISSAYIDEYVLRPLYKGTLEEENYFADFHSNIENVKFERYNNSKKFEGIILWSDNKFYTDWSLKMKKTFDA